MSNLDTSFKKHFNDEITTVNAVKEAKVSNIHIIGTENSNQAGVFIVNAINSPILGTYLLSNDISRHFAKIEKDIIKCNDYFNGGENALTYTKLNLQAGQALTDAHLIHIEDGITQVDEKIEEVKASLTNMDEVKLSLVNALKSKGFADANTDMTFDELIALVEQI